MRSCVRVCGCCSRDAACCSGNCHPTHAATRRRTLTGLPARDVDRDPLWRWRWAWHWPRAATTPGRQQWLLAVAPILLLWLVSPLVGWWISQAARTVRTGAEHADQQAFLRASARRTWRYFADFVGPTDNWLPPDNFQEYPAPLVASRTSPTNMGMSLLADLAAHDFGYIPAGELLQPRRETRWRRWKRWNATAATSTTGTTRARCSRSTRNTSRRWTAATWPAACSRCRRDSSN